MLDILIPAIFGIVALCVGGIIGYVIRKKTVIGTACHKNMFLKILL